MPLPLPRPTKSGLTSVDEDANATPKPIQGNDKTPATGSNADNTEIICYTFRRLVARFPASVAPRSIFDLSSKTPGAGGEKGRD